MSTILPLPLLDSICSSVLLQKNKYVAKYGPTFIAVHLTVYTSFLGGIFYALRTNVDIPGILSSYGLIDLNKPKKEGEKPSWLERTLAGACPGGHAVGGGHLPCCLSRRRPSPPSGSDGEDGKKKPGYGTTLLLAILCNKALFPVRTPVTLTLTPIVARAVQKYGWAGAHALGKQL